MTVYSNLKYDHPFSANATGTGALTKISSQTASASASISFTNIDSSYDEYVFKFINCHPSASSYFSFNMSTDNGANYNVTKTSTFFYGLHFESDATAQLDYDTGRDLAQGTGIQNISAGASTDNDSSISGYLHLFQPSSSIFVKHFIVRTQGMIGNPASTDNYTAGYGNTTSPINAVQFSFSSGNIDDGTILMYGVS